MTMEIISETIDETLDKDKLKKKLRSLQNRLSYSLFITQLVCFLIVLSCSSILIWVFIFRYWTRLLWPLHCSVRIYIYSTSHTQAGWYKEKTDVDIVYYR